MSILVAYSTRHGSTKEIAERIAAILRARGLAVDLEPTAAVKEVGDYEAFVIGSAAYLGSWLKDASAFVRRNQAVLATKPVWLFSSGPLGSATKDAQGRDLLALAAPNDFTELKAAIKPIGVRVFFGALNPENLGLSERLIRTLPSGRALLPEGDFRDSESIDAWAESIASELAA